MVKPSRRGPMVEHLVGSERRACRVLCVTRATYRYRSYCDPRTELRMRICEIAQARVRYGYRKIRVLLNREGWAVGSQALESKVRFADDPEVGPISGRSGSNSPSPQLTRSLVYVN